MRLSWSDPTVYSYRVTTAATPERRFLPRLTSPQVNLLLAISLTATLVTGVVSWTTSTEVARVWTVLHTIFGFMTLLLAPAKQRTSVRAGWRRGKDTRWISAMFGVFVIAGIVLGFLHSSGIWFGVGIDTPFYFHLVAGFSSIPLLIWHIKARPVNVRRISFDRRMLLRGGLTAGVASILVGVTEAGFEAAGTAGAERRFTGSHEVASGDPARMPVVSWFNDPIVRIPRERWELTIDGQLQDLDELCAMSRPVTASIDCTGGWFSEQSWDVIPMRDLLDSNARSFRVVSETGYSFLYDMADIDDLYLGVGYGGEPLRQGHGAPVRLVAPNLRGAFWVKWVVSIEPSDRPAWAQFPFPLG